VPQAGADASRPSLVGAAGGARSARARVHGLLGLARDRQGEHPRSTGRPAAGSPARPPNVDRMFVLAGSSDDVETVLALVAIDVRRQAEQRRVLHEWQSFRSHRTASRGRRPCQQGPRTGLWKPTLRRRQATEHATVAENEAERAKEDTRATPAEQQMSREGQSAGRHDEQAALERNAQQTGHDVREGAFWTTTQLLTFSSQIKNPISAGGTKSLTCSWRSM
jgi:hypothetical protein